MSNRQRRRELIFGILYTIAGCVLLFGGMAANSSEALMCGFVFLMIALASWIKLAVNSPSKPAKNRPVKQSAAQIAREQELAALKAQQEVFHQERKAAYLANPVPLQVRQWNKAFGWDWDYNRKDLDQTLYIKQYSTGNMMSCSPFAQSYEARCTFHNQGGIWYIRPTNANVQVHVNSAAAQAKCQGMAVNQHSFRVPRNTDQELIPGDCLVVICNSQVEYFRIEARQK